MEKELKIKEVEDNKFRKIIGTIIIAMENEKLNSLEKLIGKKLNN